MVADIRTAGDGVQFGEKDGEHGANLIGYGRHAGRFATGQQAFHQSGGVALQFIIETGCLQASERLQAGAHGQWIAGEGAGLINRAVGRDLAHNLFAAAVSADRQSAADNFTEAGQIGHDAETLLGATRADTEAAHHFVENQQCAFSIADVAQLLQEAVVVQ